MASTSSSRVNSLLPLVVDLDGTLIRSDVLFESANAFVSRHPLQFPKMISWLSQGKSVLKAELAQRVELNPAALPYNDVVVKFLTEERSRGREIILATASNQKFANEIAAYLGIFDKVLGSNESLNLKGQKKSELLVSLFGEKGFDYIGDSRADLSVWQHSAHVLMVSPSGMILNDASRFSTPEIIDNSQRQTFSALVRSLRLHQWVKNLLIFIPLIATHRFLIAGDDLLVVVGFISFCLVASAIYLINDLSDISHDRLHKTKVNRPLASGALAIPIAWISWPILLFAGFALSVLILPPTFSLILAGYLFLTTAYSLGLKRIAILDVVVLAALYTLRIIAGAFAISAPPSFWILTFSLFFFLSLALMKRFSELYELRIAQNNSSIGGRGYSHQDIDLVFGLGLGSGLISVLVFMFYVHDPAIENLYSAPILLWLTGPLLLIWISRAWLIAHRGQMHEDPIVFALRDVPSYLIATCLMLVFIAAMVV